MLREDLDAWSAQIKWYLDDDVNDTTTEVLQGQTALFQQAQDLLVPSYYGTWKIDLPVPTGTNNLSGYLAYDLHKIMDLNQMMRPLIVYHLVLEQKLY